MKLKDINFKDEFFHDGRRMTQVCRKRILGNRDRIWCKDVLPPHVAFSIWPSTQVKQIIRVQHESST